MTEINLPWYFTWILLPLFFVDCAFIIFVILSQSGKGGGLSSLMGGGGGALGDALGATGAERAMSKWTTRSAFAFAVLAVLLAVIGSRAARRSQDSIVKGASSGDLSAVESLMQPTPEAAPGTETGAESTDAAVPAAERAPEAAAPDAGLIPPPALPGDIGGAAQNSGTAEIPAPAQNAGSIQDSGAAEIPAPETAP